MTFTDKKPTAPGVYWWRSTAIGNLPGASFLVEIYQSGGRLFAWRDGKAYTDNVWQVWVGEWSSRLVPSDESEAYQEGYQHAFDEIVHSRARVLELEEALGSIREYWNRDNNENAMQDACWHAVNTSAEALEKGAK